MRSSFFDAMAALCALHYAEIRQYVRRLGQSRNEREDLLQDTFAAACTRPAAIPESPEQQRAWLCKIAQHIHASTQQRRVHEAAAQTILLADADEQHPSPEEPTITRHLLDRALPALTRDERELLRAYLVEGATLDELESVLGIDRSTIWARVKTLRKKMRARIAALERDVPRSPPLARQRRKPR